MQRIGEAWRRLPRVVRDLAQETGKPIELALSGGDTQVERQVLQALQDPLMHLVRNCADHGIETPDARREAGKRSADPSRSRRDVRLARADSLGIGLQEVD